GKALEKAIDDLLGRIADNCLAHPHNLTRGTAFGAKGQQGFLPVIHKADAGTALCKPQKTALAAPGEDITFGRNDVGKAQFAFEARLHDPEVDGNLEFETVGA